MPEVPSPRQNLESRVRIKLANMGYSEQGSNEIAPAAVAAFYAADTDNNYYPMVAHAAWELVIEAIGGIDAAASLRQVFVRMAEVSKAAEAAIVHPRLDPSGLPKDDGPWVPHLIDDGGRMATDDRITGAPFHYVVNGDHTECGCGGHTLECQTWGDPFWQHAASICGITRTLCLHSPRHKYRDRCDYYEAHSVGVDPTLALGEDR